MTITEKIHRIIFGTMPEPEISKPNKQWVDLTPAELKACLPIARLTGKPGVWFTTAHAMEMLNTVQDALRAKNQ